ncbi:MAG: hypothetical protein PVG75_04925 [Thioalkalispiraceae bacterium]|jgi:hypothetical protein
MKLNVYVGDDLIPIEVPEAMLADAEHIYAKMDSDMDQGWQIFQEWVDNPTTDQRCQVVADKLLTALENENQPSSMLMAGYIMTRRPDINTIHISTDGDISQTELS